MSQEGLRSALTYAEELSTIPNAPFLYKPSLEYVKNREFLRSPRVETAENIFAFFVRIREGNPKRQILITTHLDHPFVVLDGKGGGIPFGSINPELLNNSPVRVFTQKAEYLGKGLLQGSYKKGGRTVVRVSGVPHPANSHAVWNLEPSFKIHGQEVSMIAADDVITTAISLEAIASIVQHQGNLDVDIIFAFNKVEEIRQISAVGISLMKRTPFGPITRDDLIIPLEADHIESSEAQMKVSRSTGIKLPSLNGGILIKTSNRMVVLGQELESTSNEAENVILNLASKHNIKTQPCIASGVDDGTAFTIFPTSPHIVTLSIPNPNKHNYNGSPKPAYEKINLSDIESLVELIIYLGIERLDYSSSSNSTSRKLMGTKLKADSQTVAQLKREHLQALIASVPQLMSGRFFPESIFETGLDFLASVAAHTLPYLAY